MRLVIKCLIAIPLFLVLFLVGSSIGIAVFYPETKDMTFEEGFEYGSNNFEKSPEKQKLEAEVAKLEVEKQKLEVEKQKLEVEKQKLEVEKQKLEVENSDKIGSNNQCSLFCDSNNYEPVWTKSMGKYQAMSKCQSIVIDAYQSKDGKWCIELLGKIIDDQHDDKNPVDSNRIGSNNQCSLFCDSSGYQPDWVGSMGKWQASSKCGSIMVSFDSHIDYMKSKDGIWCDELEGKLFDDVLGSIPDRP